MYDTEELKRQINLAQLACQDNPGLRKQGNLWRGPCLHCGGKDRFTVKFRKGAWLWNCNVERPDQWDDAIGYVRWRDGTGFRAACEWLADWAGVPLVEDERMSPRHRSRDVKRPAVPWHLQATCEAPSALWQARGRAFIAGTQAQLWASEEALAYLRHERGLSDEVFRAAGLGYNSREAWEAIDAWGITDSEARAVYLPPGWVIPCEMGGSLQYVKIRPPAKALEEINRIRAAKGWPPVDKYHAVKSSLTAGAVYGLDSLGDLDDLIFTEGEFDCLLLRQYAGGIANVVTLGAAGSKPRSEAQAAIIRHRRVWLALDVDGPGKKAAEDLARLSQRIRLLSPPLTDGTGKDITDAWKAGIDLCDWVVKRIGPRDAERRVAWCEHHLDRLQETGGHTDLGAALVAERERACVGQH